MTFFPSDSVDDDDAAAIEEISSKTDYTPEGDSKTTLKLKLHSKLLALRELEKYVALRDEDNDETPELIIDMDDDDDDEAE